MKKSDLSFIRLSFLRLLNVSGSFGHMLENVAWKAQEQEKHTEKAEFTFCFNAESC